MTQPTFTPEQLAGVFLARWRSRDMANEFIGYLRPATLLARFGRPPKGAA